MNNGLTGLPVSMGFENERDLPNWGKERTNKANTVKTKVYVSNENVCQNKDSSLLLCFFIYFASCTYAILYQKIWFRVSSSIKPSGGPQYGLQFAKIKKFVREFIKTIWFANL